MYELQENEGQTVMLKYREIEAKDDPQIVRIIRMYDVLIIGAGHSTKPRRLHIVN